MPDFFSARSDAIPNLNSVSADLSTLQSVVPGRPVTEVMISTRFGINSTFFLGGEGLETGLLRF